MNNNNKNNILDANKYLISPRLEAELLSGFMYKDTEIKENSTKDSVKADNKSKSIEKNQLGVNVLMIRVLKDKTNTLVYNYMKYPENFILCLLIYLFNRTTKIHFLIREMGGFLAVIDHSLANIKQISNNINTLYLNPTNIMDFFNNLDYSRNNPGIPMLTLEDEPYEPIKDHPLNSYAIINLINRLNYLSNNEEMSNLIDLAYNKNYSLFIEKYCLLFLIINRCLIYETLKKVSSRI